MDESRILRLPFLHDHHSHVCLYASFEALPDLSGLDAKASMGLLAGLPHDRLNLVKGWRTERLRLDDGALAGQPPLLIVNASLHGYAFSPSALPILAELWPEFAEHAGDAAWAERNLPRIFSFYVRVAGLDQARLASFMTRMEALGLGSLEDMTIPGEEAARLLAASPYAQRVPFWASVEIFDSLSPASRAACSGVKLFLDGSLGARSAALDAAFLDGSTGSLTYADDELRRLLAGLSTRAAAISAHALGDLAIDQALRCFEELDRDGVALPPIRLEHVQFISLAQARRCKERGIALSVQPNFNADSRDYADRLDPALLGRNDPFRMLIDQAGFVPGGDLLFGSDGMPHGPEASLSWSLFPDFEGQRLSAAEFEAGYGPARGFGREGGEGSGFGSVFAIEAGARRVLRIS